MSHPLVKLGPISNPPTLLEIAKIIQKWRGLSFDDAAELFYQEVGIVAPGKDVAARAFSNSYEERRQEWDRWRLVKNECIDLLLMVAIEHTENQAKAGA